MKEYKIDFRNFVRQTLPHHKRQPVRLRLLWCFVAPLAALCAAFTVWRNSTRKLLNITCRRGVLECFLREKYHDPTITILSFREQGFELGLSPEGPLTAQAVALNASEGGGAAVPMAGESTRQFGDVDFIVLVSTATDIHAVRADIERYRPALTTYKIEQR